MPLTKKQEELIKLAEKGGRDSGLFLLDKLHELEDELSDSIKEIKNKFDNAINEIKNTVPDLDKVLASIKGKDGNNSVVPGPKGEDGNDYILTESDKKEIAGKVKIPIVEKIVEKIEVIKEQPMITNEIKEVAIAEKPEIIRNKLETLKGKERLAITAIDGLEEKIKAIPERPTTTIFGGRQARYEKFSFAGNGSTTIFTLPHVPAGKGLALWAYYQGQWLQPGVHFTISNLILTTTFIPESGTTLEGFLMV